jgi:hypothetical protein
MLDWLLTSIHVNSDIRSHIEHATLAFQHPVYWWLGLALLAPLGWYIYKRQRANLTSAPPALGRTLTATRIVILLLLVFVLGAPYLKLDQKQEKRPIMALVFDQSQSMALRAGPFDTDEEVLAAAEAAHFHVAEGKVDAETRKALNDMTRAKFVQQAVQSRADEWLKPLGEKYDLRFYSLAGELTRMPMAAEKIELAEPQPIGGETHLGDGLAQLLDEAAGRQIASVVIFSDGQNTSGRSVAEVARAAESLGAPVFAVPAGSARPLKDVSVVDVFAPDQVFKDDMVQVSATLEVQGYPQQGVKVQLIEDGVEKPLVEKDVVLKNTEQQRVDLEFKAERPGTRTLTVKIQPAGELPEDILDNNTESVGVRVSDDRLNVLYVEGLPRWDFRFLKNAIRRDKGLAGRGLRTAGALAAAAAAPTTATPTTSAPATPSLSAPRLPPDIVLEAEVRRRPPADRLVLPQTVDELAEYHVVILGDVSPSLVDSAFVEALAEAVRERGLGLIVEAGTESMPHRYDAAFLELLPVHFRSRAPGISAQAYKPFKLEITPDGAIHESMRLFDDAGRNENVWAQMPSYYWCAAAERPSPAATVLAYNPSVEGRYGKLPLVAHHYAGDGKVLFIGTDSTWLWRQNVGDRFFYKFWGQAIHFVARHDDKDANKKSWVEVRPVRARIGETARVELIAIGTDGPLNEPKLALRIEREGAAPDTIEMTADKSVAGRYVGKLTPKAVGNYRFIYEQSGGLGTVDAWMHVKHSTEETRRPNVDLDSLAVLGEVVKLGDLGTITGKLVGEAKTVELHREAPIWDNWLTLTLLVFVYSLDVGLRRLAGLS